ncbi:unnamed protein product [Polarella glacialis]|uniref:Protein kinase domain-containing protein n=1 Tax=Polarella glacialis TaxID=89957 RepID=A0A813E1W3_POLGL|nr:unnamed protein product [Polarella glacialis]
MLKGCWGKFTADAFYRPWPSAVDGTRLTRHILIRALDIIRYAEREGESVEVDLLGEGSYAKVYGMLSVAAKIISDRERPWVHKAAVKNALEADRLGLGPAVFGHGTVEQSLGGCFKGTVIFMELLESIEEWSPTDSQALLEDVRKLSESGFHNDLKMPNILRRAAGRPVMIDFDLFSPWSVKVAVTTSCIEHDFQPFLEPRGEIAVRQFREYYDLFHLSLTLQERCPSAAGP